MRFNLRSGEKQLREFLVAACLTCVSVTANPSAMKEADVVERGIDDDGAKIIADEDAVQSVCIF